MLSNGILIDERLKSNRHAENSKGEVTFDEPAQRRLRNGYRKAKRLTEHKKDVAILIDSTTRLNVHIMLPSSERF